MLSLSTGPRPILDGKNFNRFFPSLSTLENKNNVVMRDGTVEDAVALMAQVAERYKEDTSLIAKFLEGKTIEKTCENIWNFIYTYIQYKEDEDGIEQIRRPLRTWNDRASGVDCDCMSVFASSILKNLNINHYFRITKYDKPEYQHVYVVVPKDKTIDGIDSYYTVDGVIGSFNSEKKYSAHKDFNTMNGIPIQFLNGIGSIDNDHAILEYLKETKKIIESYPKRLNKNICACDAIPLFDMIITSWNDPIRKSAAFRKTAQIERINFPQLKFFQMLNDYRTGKALPEQVMKENYLNGLSSPGDSWGIGDNGDGTYYVFDWESSDTIVDNLPSYQDAVNYIMFSGDTGSGSGSGGDTGSGSGSENNSGSGSNTNWWGGVSNIITSLLNTFKPPATNNTIINPTVKPTPTPTTKTGTGITTTSILITLGVVAAIGGVLWSMNDKKPETKAIKGKTTK